MSWSQTCGLPRLRPCPWRTCRSPEDCPWTWTCLPECLPRLISASAVDPLSQQYQEFLSLSTCLSLRNCRSEFTCEGCHPDLQAYACWGYLQILGKRQQRQASPKVHYSAKPVISSDLSAQRLGTLSLRKKQSSISVCQRNLQPQMIENWVPSCSLACTTLTGRSRTDAQEKPGCCSEPKLIAVSFRYNELCLWNRS